MVNKTSLERYNPEHIFWNAHLYNDDETTQIMYGYVLPVIGIIGLILNQLIIQSLWRHGRNSLDLILTFLAIYDSFLIINSLWLFFIPTLSDYIPYYTNTIHPQIIPYILPFVHMAITGSDYLNLAVVVERVIALDRNIKKKKNRLNRNGCTPKSTKFYILKIIIFTILFNIPLFFEAQTERKDDDTFVVVETQIRFNAIYHKLYRLTFEFLIFKTTPWLTFFVTFTAIHYRINYYTDKKRIRNLNPEFFMELMDSRAVLGTITLFCLTNALALYASFCHIMLFHVSPFISKLSNLSLVINSSFKFLIYVSFSTGFRWSLISAFEREEEPLFQSDIFKNELKAKEFLSPVRTSIVTFAFSEIETDINSIENNSDICKPTDKDSFL